MSMIHGIVRFSERPSSPDELHPMLHAAHSACPDGAKTWHDQSAALGLSLLRTLPHARTAPGPVHDAQSGLTIVADVRLDNRIDLLSKLGLSDKELPNDAQLLLYAYQQWGECCVEHLVGDFAFAIWDERKRQLFCARDHFGIKPLYYTCPPDSFAFSSHLPSLLTLDEIPRELDDHAIAEMLAWFSLPQDRTLYRSVSILPAAHYLSIGEHGMVLREYWQPKIGDPIRYKRDEEYVEAYRSLLEQAVACRLETDGEASGLLSGGLDSGSITAIAAKQLAKQGDRYTAYSFVATPEQRAFEQDERELIELMHRQHNLDGHFVTTSDFHGHASDLFDTPKEYAYLSAGNAHLATLFAQLRESGSRVLLDGYGGDQCATGNHSIPLQEFLPLHNPVRILKYISAASHFRKCSKARVLLGMLRGFFPRRGATDIDYILRERSLLNREFREHINLHERAKQRWQQKSTQHRSLAAQMIHSLQGKAGLQYHSLFSANQVEQRFPFFDKRLVEFCLAVPAEQHSYDMNRRLIRRAMDGLLPDAIRLRNNKDASNAPGTLFFLHENRKHFITTIESARNNPAVTARIDIERLHDRFTTILPAVFEGNAKTTAFMPGATMGAFQMLLFLQRHTTPSLS